MRSSRISIGHALTAARVFSVVAALVLVALSTACSKTSDEDQVKAVVRAALAAANEKKVSGVLENATPDFKGQGGADLSECRRILLGFFMQQGWIHGFERVLTVEVKGEGATATLEVVLARGNEVKTLEDVLPTNARVLVFHLELGKREGAWKLTRARYDDKLR